jgi:CheY-like chemotaxis protein
MRLDFNVLWVEDQLQSVEAYRKKIERQLRKEGFKLQTEFALSVAAAKGFLSSEIYGDHIDLILMDYDLGVAPMGDEGLLAVRSIFSYKDIVFYSADVAGLLKRVATKQIQGIFCSTRDDLADTAVGVFEALVKKVLDIDHSRGIIMGATSDIDYLVNESLLMTFEKGDEKVRGNALKIIAKRLLEIRQRFEKDMKAIEAATHVSDLLQWHNLYTSVDRLNLLRKLLDKIERHKSHCDSLKIYISDTIPQRNILAHVRVERKGFSRRLVNKDGKELTSDHMRDLRRALLEHQEILEDLANALKT